MGFVLLGTTWDLKRVSNLKTHSLIMMFCHTQNLSKSKILKFFLFFEGFFFKIHSMLLHNLD